MGFYAEVETSCTCDRCGANIEDEDVFCATCANSPTSVVSARDGKCLPIYGREPGLYTCGCTYEPWRWEGRLPSFCPMCGRPL